MARIVVLPGFGGKYTSVAVGSADTYPQSKGTDDVLDLSMVDWFAVQITSTAATPTGTIRLEQSFNGSTFISMASSISIATDAIGLFPESAGPYGLIKINVSAITDGSATVTVVGFQRRP